MDYYKYRIQNDAAHTETLIALLSALPFESFEETESGFNAYIPAGQADNVSEQQIQQLVQNIDFQINKEFMPYQNWNEVWESNFQAIQIGDFCCIRAPFHETNNSVRFDIEIEPKMAFGTGHHETTFMVSEAIQDIDFNDKKVLDYGCGTGILAILASKMGATHIDAVDIEWPSYENTIENAENNDVKNIQTFHGTLDDIHDKNYDIILANINRNVILNSLEALYHKMSDKSLLLISGFLEKDKSLMEKAVRDNKFQINLVKQKNDWLCMVLEK